MNTDILGEPRFEMGNIRRKETNLPLNEARRDILNALQAALDHCGHGSQAALILIGDKNSTQ